MAILNQALKNRGFGPLNMLIMIAIESFGKILDAENFNGVIRYMKLNISERMILLEVLNPRNGAKIRVDVMDILSLSQADKNRIFSKEAQKKIKDFINIPEVKEQIRQQAEYEIKLKTYWEQRVEKARS